jgi:hypothetical protein
MFHRWRTWLAAQAGIPLGVMAGFSKWQYEQSDADALPPGDCKREAIQALVDLGEPMPWAALDGDPLVCLLSHSDCDGKIPWWKCKALALRLTGLYRDTAGNDKLGHGGLDCRRGCYDSMRRATIRFALGCLKAWKAREHVVFH